MMASCLLAIVAAAACGCAAGSHTTCMPPAAARTCLHGRVLAANGAPVANALVLVTGADQRTEGTHSDGDGRYAFACGDVHSGHIEARASSGDSLPELVVLDGHQHDVVVRATGQLVGRVRGAGLRFDVVAKMVDLAAGVGTDLGPEGQFAFRELPEGEYTLVVSCDGHPVAAVRARVRAGAVGTVVLDAPPPPPVAFVVHVTGAECTAVMLRGPGLARTSSCSGHEAAFDDVAPGKYDACASTYCEPIDVNNDRSWFELDVP